VSFWPLAMMRAELKGLHSPDPSAPPLAQPPKRASNAVRCVTAVILGWVAFAGSQTVFLELWNRTVHRPVFHYLKERDEVWLLNLVMETAVPLLGGLLGSLACIKIDRRPWWRSPASLATLASAVWVRKLAGTGTLFMPRAWLFLLVSVVSILGGAFLFSRRPAPPMRAQGVGRR
jgi:hypothetical protein